MKKILISLLVVIGFLNGVYAGQLAGFMVSVNPSTVKVGEPADMTIKALDEEGNVLTDYKGDIIITLTTKDGDELDIMDYVAPNDGTYSFTEEDQGVKTFTKGLIVNKNGDFNVKVVDFDTGKSGEAPIKVVNSEAETSDQTVEIISPAKNEINTSDSLTVIGNAVNYKNSKINVYVDDKLVTEGLIDSNGSFQVELTDLKNGNHVLEVKVLDLNGKVIGESDKVPFTVKASESLFKSIKLLPADSVDQGANITVNVEVATKVNSVVLNIANYGDFPTDRTSTTSFSSQLVANTPGKFDINLTLNTADGETKTYFNVAKLVVLEKRSIGVVQFERDNHSNSISLSWKFTGQIPQFKVLYGTGKDNLINSEIVKENKFTIKNIDSALTYYVKIVPIDNYGNVIGDESKLIVIEANMQKSATCKVDNIKVKVIKKGNNNYLVWSKIDGVNKYIVYQGDTSDNLTPVAELTGTEYKLPFDVNSKKVKYSYFAVKASCKDGSLKQIDKLKKVQTGPFDWLIYAFILSIIFYGLKLTLID